MSTNPTEKTNTSAPKAATGVFVSTIGAMHNGKVLHDLDDAIREIVKSCTASGAKGKLTLTLTVTPNGVGASETPLFKLEDEIKISLPKNKRMPSMFFADDESNLTRRDPNQTDLAFEAIDGGKAEVKTPALKSVSSE